MSDTPRTDTMIAADQQHLEDDNFFPSTVYWRMCDIARELERELAEVTEQRDRLAEAGQAVVDRWHTPHWKDVPHTAKFIQNLEDALAAVKGGKDE